MLGHYDDSLRNLVVNTHTNVAKAAASRSSKGGENQQAQLDGLLATSCLVAASDAVAASSPEIQTLPPKAPQVALVDKIVVMGNERIEISEVMSYLPIGLGDAVDAKRIALAINALFHTDHFAHVSINMQAGTLIVTVVENPTVRRAPKGKPEIEEYSGFFPENRYYNGNLKVISLDGDCISKKDTEKDFNISGILAEKLHLLDEFAVNNPGKPISNYVLEQFPNLLGSIDIGIGPNQEVAMPAIAPALWAKDKQAGDTPPVFIKRHYNLWLGNGLTRADIRQLDPQLYTAMANWLRHSELPEGFDLPTLKQQNDRWVERIKDGGAAMPSDPREIARLGLAMRYRGARTGG